MIDNFEDLAAAVVSGQTDFKKHGKVYTRLTFDERLILFKYLPTCAFQKNDEWTWLEIVSRGLIMDRQTGEIIARPFDKFFNASPEDIQSIDRVYEKVDGSLLIHYCHPETRESRFSTNGSFYSDQATDANAFWAYCGMNNIHVPNGFTLLVEWVSPDNRIVVDYGDFKGFVILGMRNVHTGDLMNRASLVSWYNMTFDDKHKEFIRLVNEHQFNSASDIFEWQENHENGVESEGFVVHTEDGGMFKVKSAAYMKLHKLVSLIDEKNIHQAMVDGRIEEFREAIPDEFIDDYDQIAQMIERRVGSVVMDVSRDLNKIAKYMGYDPAECSTPEIMQGMAADRKAFAMHAKRCKWPQYLFKSLDGADAVEIYNVILNDYMKLSKANVFTPSFL